MDSEQTTENRPAISPTPNVLRLEVELGDQHWLAGVASQRLRFRQKYAVWMALYQPDTDAPRIRRIIQDRGSNRGNQPIVIGHSIVRLRLFSIIEPVLDDGPLRERVRQEKAFLEKMAGVSYNLHTLPDGLDAAVGKVQTGT